MLMCRDALERRESCGGHFRAEYQEEDGEAKRDDEQLRPRRRLGVDRRPDEARRAIRKSSSTRSCTSRRGATSEPITSPNLTLKVWRQDGPDDGGRFETYTVDEISDEASFLEMLDLSTSA